jgi:repressor LexA
MPDQLHLAALRSYYKRNHTLPSMARLREVFGLASTSSVFALLGRLTERGYLRKVDGRLAPTVRFFERPLLGSVRAGVPQVADQSAAEALTLDDYLIDEPNRTSLHRVRGDSMRDAGILEGDLVALEHQTTAQPGDIVVAVVDGELTVKILRRMVDGRYFLEAANPEFAPIHPDQTLEILGVVVSVARRLKR